MSLVCDTVNYIRKEADMTLGQRGEYSAVCRQNNSVNIETKLYPQRLQSCPEDALSFHHKKTRDRRGWNRCNSNGKTSLVHPKLPPTREYGGPLGQGLQWVK